MSASPLDRLLALPAFVSQGALAVMPGLERIEALLEALGRPDKQVRSVLIGGTNGKGSTASMVSALFSEAGLTVGLHTSPHLVTVGERMRVNGVAASLDEVSDLFTAHEGAINEIGCSFFEAVFGLSMRWFADRQCDWAVIEVGLGGRLDATNALNHEACAITSIGMDHTHFLGDTLAAIAAEKAGIFRTDRPVVLGPLHPDADQVCTDHATQLAAPVFKPVARASADGWNLVTSKRSIDRVQLDLLGAAQGANAAVALELVDRIVPDLDEADVRRALAGVVEHSGLRARAEIVQSAPLLIVDVGHNQEAVSQTIAVFNANRTTSEACIIMGCLSDKPVEAIGRLLHSQVSDLECVLVLPTSGARGLSSTEACARLEAGGLTTCTASDSMRDAMLDAKQRGVDTLVFGSHFIAAGALKLLD